MDNLKLYAIWLLFGAWLFIFLITTHKDLRTAWRSVCRWWRVRHYEFIKEWTDWDRDSGGLPYTEQAYGLTVVYRKPITNLTVAVVAIDPPIAGMSLPVLLPVKHVNKYTVYGVTHYTHDISGITGRRFHRDGRLTFEIQHSTPGVTKDLPSGRQYRFEIVARCDGMSDHGLRISLPFDATRLRQPNSR